MMKSLSSAFLIAMMVGGFALVGTVHFGTVQASTDVPSVINSDTTWTKANSPYNLKGPTLVSNGVTLTIEPGATVNLNGYYILVNGTLSARGSSTDQIHFNSGIIRFTESSSDWNEQTGSGCIIENANLSSTRIEIGNSPKINNNSIYELGVDGSPTISENTILGRVAISGISGSPAILHNSITNSTPGSVSVGGGSPTISHNTINCRIIVGGGSPTISHNTINDGVHVDSRGGDTLISDNIITSFSDFTLIHIQGVPAVISNNNLIGTENQGIYIVGPYSFSISDNIISNCSAAITAKNPCPLTIERNLISNNVDGISLMISASVYSYVEHAWISPADFPLTIRNNSISDNSGVGISLDHPSAIIMNNRIANNYIGITIREPSEYSPSPIILNNNIYANEYNLKSEVSDNINATYNWWGTTDIPTINQTIYDFKYDFNSGTVNFIPFLTEPNPIPKFPDTTPPTISIVSPENKTYTVNNVSLTFTVSKQTLWIGYSLDDQANVAITGNTTLTGLSDGTHNLTVYATNIFGNIGSSVRVHFTIDTTLPSISILSPENKTYDTTKIPLNFTVNETVSWMGYSLDGQANVTIAGNTTLTGLSDGMHSLVVYARDTAGYTGASETIHFSIEAFPITWIAVAIVLIAPIGAALLVYFAKVKKTSQKSNDSRVSIMGTSVTYTHTACSCFAHLQTKTTQNIKGWITTT